MQLSQGSGSHPSCRLTSHPAPSSPSSISPPNLTSPQVQPHVHTLLVPVPVIILEVPKTAPGHQG